MQGWKTIDARIKGIVPLMLCNGQLANPLNPIVKAMKEITGKGRNKTDDDYERLALLEWEGGLYLDEDRRVVIPGYVIEGMLTKAAKKIRQRPHVQAGVLCDGNWPLEYDGPKDFDKLRADLRFRDTRNARPNGKVVQRTRPIFDRWAVSFTLHYDPSEVNPDLVQQILGLGCIGDYIPKFGRFVIEEFKPEGKKAAKSA